jgi:hypothetical protein
MSQPLLVVRWKNSEGLWKVCALVRVLWSMECDDGSLQLGLDTDGLASGIDVGGGERGGGEVRVAAAHGVGDEAGKDGCGAGNGRHFGGCVCRWVGGW